MSKHNALEELFSDIADAIREKTGETGRIAAVGIPDIIRNRLQAISSSSLNEMYQVNITEALFIDCNGESVDVGPNDKITLYTDAPSYLDEIPVSVSSEIKSYFDDMIVVLEEANSLAELVPEVEGYEPIMSLTSYISDGITALFEDGGTARINTDVNAHDYGEFGPILRYIDRQIVLSMDEYAEVLEDGILRLVINQPGPLIVICKSFLK